MRGQFMASHDAHNLNALFVKKTNKPRKYSYRLGLYLIVCKKWSLTKRWKLLDFLVLSSLQHFLTAFRDTRQKAIISKSALRNWAGSRQFKKGTMAHSIGQKMNQFRNNLSDMYL